MDFKFIRDEYNSISRFCGTIFTFYIVILQNSQGYSMTFLVNINQFWIFSVMNLNSENHFIVNIQRGFFSANLMFYSLHNFVVLFIPLQNNFLQNLEDLACVQDKIFIRQLDLRS